MLREISVLNGHANAERPRIAVTMGDVAGVGPEVIARVLADQRMWQWCRPVVVGNADVMRRAIALIGSTATVVSLEDLTSLDSASTDWHRISCWNPTDNQAAAVAPAALDAHAGNAAYEYLVRATNAALSGLVDAITTAPLNKAALQAAGHRYPGHTEILADICNVDEFGMMLYLPASGNVRPRNGLGVVHTTLHTSIRSVPDLLSAPAVQEKIQLVSQFMQYVGCAEPRVGVCALNPHAGENQLFGDEESRIITPAVEAARQSGIHVTGPLPADTLLRRAVCGEFDAVVAMYHDQGHIALKLIDFERTVNVTLGLPIIRTSPSHGTGFDIAWQGRAHADGMLEALRIAALLATRTTNLTDLSLQSR